MGAKLGSPHLMVNVVSIGSSTGLSSWTKGYENVGARREKYRKLLQSPLSNGQFSCMVRALNASQHNRADGTKRYQYLTAGGFWLQRLRDLAPSRRQRNNWVVRPHAGTMAQ